MQTLIYEQGGDFDTGVTDFIMLAEMSPIVNHVRSELGPFNFDSNP